MPSLKLLPRSRLSVENSAKTKTEKLKALTANFLLKPSGESTFFFHVLGHLCRSKKLMYVYKANERSLWQRADGRSVLGEVTCEPPSHQHHQRQRQEARSFLFGISSPLPVIANNKKPPLPPSALRSKPLLIPASSILHLHLPQTFCRFHVLW